MSSTLWVIIEIGVLNIWVHKEGTKMINQVIYIKNPLKFRRKVTFSPIISHERVQISTQLN